MFRQHKSDTVQRTCRDAVHAADTAFVVKPSRSGINTACRTAPGAFAAFHAASLDRQTEHAEPGRQPQQSSDRTNRRTENPFFPDRQHGNHQQRNKAAGSKRTGNAACIRIRIQQEKSGTPAAEKQSERHARNRITQSRQIRHRHRFPPRQKDDHILQNAEWTEYRAVKTSEQNSEQHDSQNRPQRPQGKRRKTTHQCGSELCMKQRCRGSAHPGKRQTIQQKKNRRGGNAPRFPAEYSAFFHDFPLSFILQTAIYSLLLRDANSFFRKKCIFSKKRYVQPETHPRTAAISSAICPTVKPQSRRKRS